MQQPIYLDYQSTTPVAPSVLEAMLPYFAEQFANPSSSSHQPGTDADTAVKHARETIAAHLGAKPKEIIFTSGATEALNLAIKGVAESSKERGKHLVTVATEHHAVLDTYTFLEANGFETTVLPVGADGLLDVSTLADAIRDDTVLVSVMAANNEIGTIQPIGDVGKLCRERAVYFLTDATQALGKRTLDVNELNIDLLAGSAHKMYGPKGVGILYVRSLSPKVRLAPQLHGGGQERSLRSGTVNVPGVVGAAKALDIALSGAREEQRRLAALRDRLLERLLETVPGISVNGTMESRLPNNLSIRIDQIDAQAVMLSLRNQLAVSSGSACSSAGTTPSHVLTAIGLTERQSHSSLRFGLGRFTTEEEIYTAAKLIAQEVTRALAFTA